MSFAMEPYLALLLIGFLPSEGWRWLGIMLGRVLGSLAGKRAEIVGGLMLIGIGAAILYEHLSA